MVLWVCGRRGVRVAAGSWGMSALALTADSSLTLRHVGYVPRRDMPLSLVSALSIKDRSIPVVPLSRHAKLRG